MDRSQTAEAISGRATGVLFFAGFGTLWFCTGLAAMHRLNLGTGAIAALILAALVIPALWVLKRASGLPKQTANPEVEAQISRTFNRANTAQWIAIPVAVVLLNIVHQAAYIVPASRHHSRPASLSPGTCIPVSHALRDRCPAGSVVGRKRIYFAPRERCISRRLGDVSHPAAQRCLHPGQRRSCGRIPQPLGHFQRIPLCLCVLCG